VTRSEGADRPEGPPEGSLEPLSVRGRDTRVRTRDLLLFAALAVHLALVLSLRVSAWPDVTTPAYLWSRGMLLYRDIKFQHGPGVMGTLALAFLAFGVHTWVVRAYAIVWPVIAHLFVLRYTRSFGLAERALASAFILAVFFSMEGNSNWPTAVMAAASLPIAADVSRDRIVRAGLLIGLAILFKQTAAYVLVFAFFGLALERRWRSAALLALVSCVPYWVTAFAFSFLGAGPEMLRWTLEVPLTIRPSFITARPSAYDASVLLFAFLPTVVDALLERPGEHEVRSRWLLLVAAGFAAICYPRFGLPQTLAAVPCLAVGAARFLRRLSLRPLLRAGAYGLVAMFTLSRAAILGSSGEFDGKVLFWNHEPALDGLAARLRELPPDTPLHSTLWDNLLPRAGLLPPGRLYVNPYFTWFFAVDDVGDRVQAALRRTGGVVVGYRSSRFGRDVIGPYRIFRVKPQDTRTAE
jgi:hypothetical protein